MYLRSVFILAFIPFILGISSTPKMVTEDLNNKLHLYSKKTYAKPSSERELKSIIVEINNKNFEKALKRLLPLAKAGDRLAQYYLGFTYDIGFNNYEDAAMWYQKSASQQVALAQNSLAVLYTNGEGVQKDDAQAVRWYREAAKLGYPEAQFNLGSRYDRGLGVPKNLTKAREWYKKSAENKHPKATFNLAIFYIKGSGGEVDQEKALELMLQSAKLGVIESYDILGHMYLNGLGTKKNLHVAVNWYKKAISHGSKQAKGMAPKLDALLRKNHSDAFKHYSSGYRELQAGNPTQAEGLFTMALELNPNFVDIYIPLGTSLGMQGKFDDAVTVYLEAISKGSKDANLFGNLGFTLSKIGKWDEAIKYYRMALDIEPKHAKATYNLKKALQQVANQ